LHGEVSGLLHRLDGKILHTLHDNSPLAAAPRDNGGPIFVIMAPTRFTLLAPPPLTAAQRLLPALVCLALLASGMVEFVGFDGPFYVVIRLVGDSRISQPSAPPIARADMDTQFSGNAPRRTQQAQQKGGQNPM
jgi:hypothetical protein